MNTIAIVIAVVAVYREVAYVLERRAWNKERQALLDRLMARSLPEYKIEQRRELPKKPVAHRAPNDEEMAKWEAAHASQLQNNQAEMEKKLSELRSKAVKATGGSHA